MIDIELIAGTEEGRRFLYELVAQHDGFADAYVRGNSVEDNIFLAGSKAVVTPLVKQLLQKPAILNTMIVEHAERETNERIKRQHKQHRDDNSVEHRDRDDFGEYGSDD